MTRASGNNIDMANVSQLCRSASHALRTPLSVLMLELGSIQDKRARELETDVAAIAEALRKTFFLLKLTAGDGGRHAKFDLTKEVERLHEEFSGECKQAAIEVIVEAQGMHLVEGYLDAAYEAFCCLMRNALDCTPPQGRIKLTAQNSALIIEDSGPGISADAVAAGFQPFQYLSDDGRRMGIGIPLAQTVASLHGGQLLIGRSGLGGTRAMMLFGASS